MQWENCIANRSESEAGGTETSGRRSGAAALDCGMFPLLEADDSDGIEAATVILIGG